MTPIRIDIREVVVYRNIEIWSLKLRYYVCIKHGASRPIEFSYSTLIINDLTQVQQRSNERIIRIITSFVIKDMIINYAR